MTAPLQPQARTRFPMETFCRDFCWGYGQVASQKLRLEKRPWRWQLLSPAALLNASRLATATYACRWLRHFETTLQFISLGKLRDRKSVV